MRYIFILLCILGSIPATLAQTGKPAPVITRYYCFTGTIDKYPVTFHLYRIGDKFSGTYYYNSSEEAIDVNGGMDKNRFLRLTHSNNEGDEQEELAGNFKDSSFAGTWTSKGKLLSFRLVQKNDNSGLAFDYIYTAGSKKLPKKEDIYRDELSYDAATIWPTASSTHPAVNLIKQVVFEEFGYKSAQGEIGKFMLEEKNDFLYGKKSNEDIEEYALSRRVQVEYRSEKLLTLSSFGYFDGGGAHGNYGTGYVNIDLAHNRKLEISDVLDTLACREMLSSLLEKKFRAAHGVKKEESLTEYLFDDHIKPNGNFSLTSKGIRFNYNPYEIAAYAFGEISIYIPYKELTSCLKPEFKQLVNGQW
jgi:hypothetical protein